MSLTIPQIFFTDQSLHRTLLMAEKKRNVETGGLILGKICRHETGRALIVTKVTGPGPGACHKPLGFQPDVNYYRKVRKQNSGLIYLGEWHTHPSGCTSWSMDDLEQAHKILKHEGIPELLCPIYFQSQSQNGITRFQLNCFYINRALQVFVPLSYNVIPEPEDKSIVRYVALEEGVAKKFLAGHKKYALVPGDLYADDGILHIYSRLCNWVAHQLKIPAIFVGLLARAEGGRVWRVVPGRTACYECYSRFQGTEKKTSVAYSEIESLRDLTVQPGLGNDIAFVTHLAVRYVIDNLKQTRNPQKLEKLTDLSFWFNRKNPKWKVEDLSIFHIDALPPNPDCSMCKNSSNRIKE